MDGLDQGSRPSPRPIRKPGSSSGVRTRPGSGRRAGCAIAGMSAGCVRRARPTSATTASISSPPAGPAPTRPSPLPCRVPRPRPWRCSSPPSRSNWTPACTPSCFWTGPAGISRRSSPCRTMSRCCHCRPAAPNSTPWSASGSTRAVRFLSHRLHRDYTAVLDATCAAWNRLLQEKGRLASLTGYAYLMQSELA